jgi:hypothetical protein
VTDRKKKILLVQIIIFIFATLLIYFTYYNRDNEMKKIKNIDLKKKENTTTDNLNTFEDIEYKGIDLNGNRYEIKSEIASFDVKSPELIDMKIMKGIFYFKDGTILTVTGDYGKYNNKTMDMEFKNNVVAKYIDNILYADNLNYMNTKNMLTIYGNVKTESVKGSIAADKLEFDLSDQTLDASMFNEEQIKIKLRN